MDHLSPPPGSASTFVWSPGWGRKLAFVLAILLITRLGQFVPVPGLDVDTLKTFPMVGNGAISRMSVFALGLFPFLSAWIASEVFRGKSSDTDVAFNRRQLTFAFALVQGWGIARSLEGVRNLVEEPGLAFQLTAALSLAAGTMMLLWLGEQITKSGFCDGVWLIIAANWISDVPGFVPQLVTLYMGTTYSAQLSSVTIALILLMPPALLSVIVLVELARRHIPLIDKSTGAPAGTLPLKLDEVTLLVASMAAFLMLLPFTIVSVVEGRSSDFFAEIAAALGRGAPLYFICYAVLLVAFTFFSVAGTLSPRRLAAWIDAEGKALPGVPSDHAVSRLDGIVTRITAIVAIYVLVLCVLPEILMTYFAAPLIVTGTSLLIIAIAMLDILARAPRREAAADEKTENVKPAE